MRFFLSLAALAVVVLIGCKTAGSHQASTLRGAETENAAEVPRGYASSCPLGQGDQVRANCLDGVDEQLFLKIRKNQLTASGPCTSAYVKLTDTENGHYTLYCTYVDVNTESLAVTRWFALNPDGNSSGASAYQLEVHTGMTSSTLTTEYSGDTVAKFGDKLAKNTYEITLTNGWEFKKPEGNSGNLREIKIVKSDASD